jgi:hypothetical protein
MAAVIGVGCGAVASGGFPPVTERIDGDPPVSASVEFAGNAEGTTPQGAAITSLDIDVRADLPEPVATTCDGLGVGVLLRSGRDVHYPPCAMPREIVELRDSLYRAGG